jgi:heme-degrading monooxygenase HmoA
MITRIWHGKTKAEHADVYLKYVQETGLKDYQKISGNLSAKILRKIEGNICHFYTITEWDSLESIKQFAGEDFEKARYYDDDEKYLLELEEKVNHYETFTQPPN